MATETPFPLEIQPGVIKTETTRVIEGRWQDADKVRFHRGRPQKIGGWVRITDTPTSGVPRKMLAWRGLTGLDFYAAGTYRKLYAYSNTFEQHDITPLRAEGTLIEDPFTTKDGSTLVVVEHAANGVKPGDTVIFSGADPVNGVDPNGTWIVTSVDGTGLYTIDMEQEANADGAGGGTTVAYQYEINVGTEHGSQGFGYGIGRYGLGTYGTARETTPVQNEPRVWSLDHLGKLGIFTPGGASIYVFDPENNPPWQRATKIADAPDDVRASFVTDERIIFALCEGMRVDWNSQTDYTDWTPSQTNTANSRTLTKGSKLVAGRVLGNNVNLIWSDFAVFQFQYSGSTIVYDSRVMGEKCGLISPNAVQVVNGIAYWMGPDNFWLFNSAVQEIPNVDDIKGYVFEGIRENGEVIEPGQDPLYGYLCTSVYIPQFNEIIFFFVPFGSDEPGRYVILNLSDYSWVPGTLERTAGMARESGDTRPILGAADGHFYQHEEGVDANGEAMEAHITLAPYAIAEGDQIIEIYGIVADFFEQAGGVDLTLRGFDRLRHAEVDEETHSYDNDDDLIDWHLSGRYVGMTIYSNSLGGYFRLGRPTILGKTSGRRR